MTVQLAEWDRRAARRGDLDGQFLIGTLAAGTYNLPSCKLPLGRHAEPLLFVSEAMAKAAGLSPCKVCRPDRFHASLGDGLGLFKDLTGLVAADPTIAPSIEALASHVALSVPRLEVVLGDHAHLTAVEWLNRQRIRFAAALLLTTRMTSADIGLAAGFTDVASYAETFTDLMCMTPVEYRALGRDATFRLRLPRDYRTFEVLKYQGRDPEGLAERSDEKRVWKALSTPDGPAVLEIAFSKARATVKVTSRRKLGTGSFARLHRDTLKILGLGSDIGAFEARHPDLVGDRRGLRVPLIPSAFDALSWAIMGQQINISFAGSLRRDLILLAGAKVGDMFVHPTPEAVAKLDAADLTSRRFSRSKAKYLIEAAQSIVRGDLPIESLVDGSAIEAEKLLTAQHGIGTWTARYVLMRTGFADAAPVGDSGLATALQRLHDLPDRPDAVGTARLMARYSPWRSLASMHLWSSLQ